LGETVPLSPLEQAITDHLSVVFGRPLAPGHRVNDREPAIYVTSVQDYPAKHMVTLSTIGVSNYSLHRDDGSIYAPTRVEFIASCQKHEAEDMALVLRDAAYFVSDRRRFVRPGIFLFDLIGQFRRETTVPHGLLTTPFAYDGLNDHGPFAGTVVSWLQILPAATNEIEYAMRLSSDELEELFVKEDIDWDRLDRVPLL
jgi:hypothetical protein